jgi:hypothetical protein
LVLICVSLTLRIFYSRNAGVITEVKGKQNLVGEAMDHARAELDGRTGETDSEIEPEEVNQPDEGMH